MKRLIIFYAISLFTTTSIFAQIDINASVLQDANLEQLIIATYPVLDGDHNGRITYYEADLNILGTMEITFLSTYSGQNGIDFTGMDHFHFSTLRLINSSGTPIAGSNLDLLKIGRGAAPGTVNSLQELKIEGIYFSNLDFSARGIYNLIILNCGQSMNLETLHLAPLVMQKLQIAGSGLFAKLDLSTLLNLQDVNISDTYIEEVDFNVASSYNSLTHIHLSNLSQLTTLVLPGASGVTSYVKTLELIGTSHPFFLTSLDLTQQTELTNLYLISNDGNSKITTLDLSKSTKLTNVTVTNFDGLTGLDFANNTLLTDLTLTNNSNLRSLNLSANTELLSLVCSNNSLSTLDLTNNTKLTSLDCSYNSISSLLLGTNTALEDLICDSNALTSLDVSLNTSLITLKCSTNHINHIDVSNNIALNWIVCNSNDLVSLNIANGNNVNMNQWDVTGLSCNSNPNLKCIIVDNNVVNNIPQNWFKDGTANYTIDDEINVTDANFKTALLNNPTNIDIDGNGKISTCEAENFIGTIDVHNQNISDLTSIGSFPNAVGLDCSNNNLQFLDLSSSPSLTSINCNNNAIPSLDLSFLTGLTTLRLNNNQVNGLVLTTNINLTTLDCSSNNLTILDTSNNILLETFVCNDNQLTSVNVTKNTHLTTLHCFNNPFVSLSLMPTTIDLSTNTALLHINCSNNNITELDVSKQTSLIELFCQDNLLTSLNIANGNNLNMQWMDATNNLNLFCIQVDSNVINAIPVNWTKELATSYSTSACTTTTCQAISFPDANFKQGLLNIMPAIDTNSDDIIQDCEARMFTGTLDVSNLGLTDLTGIEAFTNIIGIDCSNNNLTSLDLRYNIKLTSIAASGNSGLASITLPGGYNVAVGNKNKSHKISATNSVLTTLDLHNDALTTLDLHSYSGLSTLDVSNNNLTSLNIQNGNNSNITATNFNASGNANLSTIVVDDVTYATTNWTNVDSSGSFTTNSTLGVGSELLNTSISIYPNPTLGMISIDKPYDVKINKIQIYNTIGKEMKYINKVNSVINVSRLSSGIYFLRVNTNKGVLVKKLVKQ